LTYNITEDLDKEQIATVVASVLHPENLESMVRTAVYHEVENQVRHFFKSRPDFVPQTISSYS